MLLRPRSRSGHQGMSGQIMRLHVGYGALQPIGNLQIHKRDLTISVGVKRVSGAEAPYIFMRTSTKDEARSRVRAIHLPHGERWVHTLPVADLEMFNTLTPPAISDTTVAIAYNEWPRDTGQAGVTQLALHRPRERTRQRRPRLAARRIPARRPAQARHAWFRFDFGRPRSTAGFGVTMNSRKQTKFSAMLIPCAVLAAAFCTPSLRCE